MFDIARGIKTDNPTVPIVVLTPFSHGIRKSMQNMDFPSSIMCFAGWAIQTCYSLSSTDRRQNEPGERRGSRGADDTAGRRLHPFLFLHPAQPLSVRTPASLEFSTEALNAQLETLRMRGGRKSCWPVRMKRPGTCTPAIRRTRWGSSATAVFPVTGRRTRWPGTSYCRPSVPKTSSCR